jgi:hypothetical protein
MEIKAEVMEEKEEKEKEKKKRRKLILIKSNNPHLISKK